MMAVAELVAASAVVATAEAAMAAAVSTAETMAG